MANEWHYSKNGKRFGPVSGQQLKELAAKGELGPADLVWKEGMPQWVPASKIKGLMPGSSAVTNKPASPTSTAVPAKSGTPVKPSAKTEDTHRDGSDLPKKTAVVSTRTKVLVVVSVAVLGLCLVGGVISLSGWMFFKGKGGGQPIAEADKKKAGDDKLPGKPGDKNNDGLQAGNKKAADKTPTSPSDIGVVPEPLAILPLQERELVAHAVQFSADSALLLSGSQTHGRASGERPLDMSLWDVASKQQIQLQPVTKSDYLASTFVAEFSPTAPILTCVSELHTKYPNADAFTNAQKNNAKAPLFRSLWHIKGKEAQMLGGDERLGLASSIDKRGCSWRKMLWSKDGSLMVVRGAYGLDFLRLDTAKNDITKVGGIVFKKNLGIIGADEVYYPDPSFIDASLSPDGTFLATHFDAKEKGIQIWGVPKGQIMVRLNPTERKSSGSPFGFSPDGKTLAASQIVEQKKFEEKRVVVLWDTTTWKTKHVLFPDDLHDAFGRPVDFHEFAAFSPDGKAVVTKSQWQSGTPIHNHAISVWDVATGQRKYFFNTISAADVRFSPDGRLLLTGGHSVAKTNMQYNVNLWDADSGVLKNRITDKGVLTASFAPNGKLVATGHSNGAVKVWDITRTQNGSALPEYVSNGKAEPEDVASQSNRERIEANLRGMNLNDLIKKYGQPDVIWTNPKRTNLKLYAWKLGGSKTDLYVVQLVIYAIDGRSPNVHENPVVRTSKEFEQMKQGIMNAAK